MHPLVKKYRERRRFTQKKEEFKPDSTFWGIFGSSIPWGIWGYIVGAAIGWFIVIYYVIWPVFKILYVDPFTGGN